MAKKITLLFFSFLFVFSIEFVFFPIRVRWILALVGMYLLYKEYKQIYPRVKKKPWRKLFSSVILLLFIAFASTLINGNLDLYFFKYPIQIVISLSSAYAFLYLIKSFLNIELSRNDIITLFIHVCAIQCILSALGFINPSITNVLLSLIKQNEMALDAQESYMGSVGRILSIGAGFFNAGTLFSTVIAISPLVIIAEKRNWFRLLYTIEVLIIFFLGAAISRTTLLGIFGFVFAFLVGGEGHLISFKSIRTLLLVSLAIFGAVWIYGTFFEHSDLFEQAFQRAFSIFYLFKDTGELQDFESMAGHSLWPSNSLTWIIGDGLMSDPKNPELGYYMGQDRGVNRVVYGIGLVGLFAYSLVQWRLCQLTKLKTIIQLMLFAYYCAFMFKGIYSVETNLSLLIMVEIFGVMHSKATIDKVNKVGVGCSLNVQ